MKYTIKSLFNTFGQKEEEINFLKYNGISENNAISYINFKHKNPIEYNFLKRYFSIRFIRLIDLFINKGEDYLINFYNQLNGVLK